MPGVTCCHVVETGSWRHHFLLPHLLHATKDVHINCITIHRVLAPHIMASNSPRGGGGSWLSTSERRPHAAPTAARGLDAIGAGEAAPLPARVAGGGACGSPALATATK